VSGSRSVWGFQAPIVLLHIPKKPGGIGADVAKVEGTVMELKRNWPVYCNSSVDKEQFWVI